MHWHTTNKHLSVYSIRILRNEPSRSAMCTKRKVSFPNAALSKVTTVKQHKMQVRLLHNADSAQMVS